MLCNILAVGDVVGESGMDCLNHHLRAIQKTYEVNFTVVNGENAAGIGLLPRHADMIFDAGADVITLGNHTWSKLQITDYLEDNRYILRPANFAPRLPGRGWGVYDGPRGLRIGVVSLMGRYELNSNLDNPFTKADEILREMDASLVLVDFHAEATSEKLAMGYYLDGRVSAVWGTHTHVPTADASVLPKGTGYCTDLGMTGPKNSVLGVVPEQSINLFLGGLPKRYQTASGPCKLNAVLFTLDTETGRCVQVRRIDICD
ncbi:MAG: TIGR00282 family metallophosphoesterase [Oscillospiraceae bacterium]|nr:TIGR00282 family metallophosphoesterase [Oscillospiraceae bacterium]